MTCAGRSRSRSLALPVSARTRRTSSIGNVLAITPRLMRSLRRTPAGRPAGTRAIAVAHPRASASMAQPHLYVNGIGASRHFPDGLGRYLIPALESFDRWSTSPLAASRGEVTGQDFLGPV